LVVLGHRRHGNHRKPAARRADSRRRVACPLRHDPPPLPSRQVRDRARFPIVTVDVGLVEKKEPRPAHNHRHTRAGPGSRACPGYQGDHSTRWRTRDHDPGDLGWHGGAQDSPGGQPAGLV